VHFNDTRCGSVAELRSVILKARRLAEDHAEQERAAAAVKTWLLGSTKNDPRRRRILWKPRRTSRSPPNASLPDGRSHAWNGTAADRPALAYVTIEVPPDAIVPSETPAPPAGVFSDGLYPSATTRCAPTVSAAS
jgi:hypothetical protein